MVRMKGRARRVGDDLNTDYIVSSSRKADSVDPNYLRDFVFEVLDPSLAQSLQSGDLIVAGRNFGCGSAMEVAVTAILAANVKAVLAESFARTYYRNAVNNGLVPLECDTSAIREGDQVSIRLTSGSAEIHNITQGLEIRSEGFAPLLMEILESGGLVPHIRRHGRIQSNGGGGKFSRSLRATESE